MPFCIQKEAGQKGHTFASMRLTEIDSRAHDMAMRQVMNRHGFVMFNPQGEANKPGYHSAEIVMPLSDEKLGKLLLELEEKAHEYNTQLRAAYPASDPQNRHMYEPQQLDYASERIFDKIDEKSKYQRQAAARGESPLAAQVPVQQDSMNWELV